MDSRQIDLALRKQKLQMRADAQRTDLTRRLAGIDGALDRVDSLRDNLAWAKDKIPLLSVALLVVLAAKPKLTLRLAKRAWVGWLLVRQARGGGEKVAGALAGEYWLGGGFWMVLAAALVCGFAPILAHRLWRRLHHKR